MRSNISATKAVKKKQSSTCYPRGINTSYDSSKHFTFQILNWEGVDEGLIPSPSAKNICFDEERQYTVYMTGSTEKGNSVVLRTTFDPYFMVKLSSNNGRKWERSEIDAFIDGYVISKYKEKYQGFKKNQYESAYEQKSRYYRVLSDPNNPDEGDREDSAVMLSYTSAFRGWDEVWLKDWDEGFTGIVPKKFQFIRLKFSTFTAMQKCANRMTNKEIVDYLNGLGKQVKVYESNLGM